MKVKPLMAVLTLTYLLLTLSTTQVRGQVIDTTFEYSILRNKRIIKLKHQTKWWKTKRIKESTFIGIKSKDSNQVIFGRLDLIRDSTLLLTTLKYNNDTIIVENPRYLDGKLDTIVNQSGDYDTSYFIKLSNIVSIYHSTNNQLIKTEIAALLFSTGLVFIVTPPIVGGLLAGGLSGFFASPLAYITASGIPMALLGYLKLRNIRRFKEYDLTKNWQIHFREKGF